MKPRRSESKFVLCIRNDGAEDLETRKVCQVLPDRAATLDDLYPAEYFVPVKLPVEVARELGALPDSARQTADDLRHRSVRTRARAVRG